MHTCKNDIYLEENLINDKQSLSSLINQFHSNQYTVCGVENIDEINRTVPHFTPASSKSVS